MTNTPMPTEIIAWMQERRWGDHHLRWHVERMWDLLDEEVIAWATQQGWARNSIQEGEEGNGIQFLAMHRVMMQKLTTAFPVHRDLFAGWSVPPTDPSDPVDPLPNNGTAQVPPTMQAAIDRLHGGLEDFNGEDEFGRFVETALRPFPNQPRRRSSDPSAGIHNFMHNRFTDRTSLINMGDPSVNIENRQFWRLHGWIDARWSAYRTTSGRSDGDPAYLAALAAEAEHMPDTHVHHRPVEAARPRLMPQRVKSAILRTLEER